ncbi:MAG: hypothetical protein A4E74_02522 [Syntrophus sp. PtaB.Bin075]|nr:MAG: hypothetical protein A4E74_02522 [Syntrophus sp. PtaB.Bin075]
MKVKNNVEQADGSVKMECIKEVGRKKDSIFH